MKTPTDQQIKAEIKALQELKKTIPKKTFFGDDNHERLDAQIEVLENRMTEKQIENRFYVDETSEDYHEGDNDLWSHAGEAHRWMVGEDKEAPSSGWK